MAIVPTNKDQSYGLREDNFKGDNVCKNCYKLNDKGNCTAYRPEGMVRWQKMGNCPLSGRWADWREDKPKEIIKKRRVGQGKTKQGGNL